MSTDSIMKMATNMNTTLDDAGDGLFEVLYEMLTTRVGFRGDSYDNGPCGGARYGWIVNGDIYAEEMSGMVMSDKGYFRVIDK